MRRCFCSLTYGPSILMLAFAAAVFGVVAQGGITPVAGQQDTSPLTGQAAEKSDYPDASRWPGGELEKAKGRVPSEELNDKALANPDSWLGALLQAGLPAGLTLAEGVAFRVMSGPAEKWFVIYPFNYRGVRVGKYSDAFAVVSAAGEMHYIRRRNVPAAIDASEPNVPAEAALAIARRKALEDFGPVDLKESPLELEVWVEPSLAGRLAWTLTIESASLTDPQARRYWVAAVGQPQVLQTENLVYFGHSGTVSAKIWDTSPFSLFPPTIHALPEVNLTRDPGGAVQVSGLDGRYIYPAGGGTATITSTLEGPRCMVSSQAGAGLKTSASGELGSPIDLTFQASDEQERAQTSAYFWTNAAYQFARSILDPLPKQDFAKLPVNVNIPSFCNAFFLSKPGLSINFLLSGCSCPNTAYSDVVAHEYGHVVDHCVGGIRSAPYSEGFGDAMALLLTRQSCYGRDFFGAGTCSRDANAVNMWPPDVLRERPHLQGKRYAQFVWQLVQQLRATLSEGESFRLAQRLLLAVATSDPSSIPDAVTLSFIADDNDGNLANGTPHCRELGAAAESRKIPVPASLPRTGRCRARRPGAHP